MNFNSFLSIKDNTFSHHDSAPLQFVSTGNGYFKFGSSTGWTIPIGTTAQRPVGPDLGTIRYNTTSFTPEVYANVSGTTTVTITTITADINIGSGAEVKINGTEINLNGPKNAETAAAADFVKPYDLRDNPATSTAAGWDKRYQAGIVKSFMKRIPMHEPWALHEHRAPDLLTPDKTDRDI